MHSLPKFLADFPQIGHLENFGNERTCLFAPSIIDYLQSTHYLHVCPFFQVINFLCSQAVPFPKMCRFSFNKGQLVISKPDKALIWWRSIYFSIHIHYSSGSVIIRILSQLARRDQTPTSSLLLTTMAAWVWTQPSMVHHPTIQHHTTTTVRYFFFLSGDDTSNRGSRRDASRAPGMFSFLLY